MSAVWIVWLAAETLVLRAVARARELSGRSRDALVVFRCEALWSAFWG
jgi:hypothetical protein